MQTRHNRHCIFELFKVTVFEVKMIFCALLSKILDLELYILRFEFSNILLKNLISRYRN